jgi:hypothetical protein
MCASAHRAMYFSRRLLWSEGTPTKEGSEAMITLRPNTADLMFSERRVSLGWILAGLVFGGNVASAVLMLLGQG